MRTTAWSSTIRTRITSLIAAAPSQGNLGDDRRAGVRARLELQLPAQQREPLAHPEQAETLGAGVGHEAAAVVLDHRGDRARAAGEHDADRARLRVLDDVRQRLLHDPIERRLDVVREPVADAGLELDPHSRLLGEGLAQALERGDEPEVVQRLRAQLHREPADVVERLDDLLAHGGERRGPLLVGPRLLDGLQTEQHRRQLLPGLVVELARQPAPLELLRLDHPAQRIARDARREVDGDGGPGRERLGEPQVGLGEAGVAAFAVVRDDHADRPARGEERGVEAAAGAEAPGRLLVDLGIVEERVDPLGAAALQDAAALRARSLELQADDLGRALAVGRLDPERPVAGRQRDRHQPRADQLAQPAGDQLEQARELDLARQRRPDLVQRLELNRPGGRRLVEPRVLDRDRRLARERLDELLVGGR